jgi:hypothetical protein
MESLELTDSAVKVHKEIKELRDKVENVVLMSTFELGRLLKQMRDEKLYEQLGYETFLTYLAEPDISFSQASAYNAIKLYEVYELQLKKKDELQGIPTRRLVTLLPMVNDKNVDDWLSKARSLSASDLRLELEEGRKANGENHPEEFHSLSRCTTCGKFRLDIPLEELCNCDKKTI